MDAQKYVREILKAIENKTGNEQFIELYRIVTAIYKLGKIEGYKTTLDIFKEMVGIVD